MSTINILIADDLRMFVEGLAALLQDVKEIHIVATASNGSEALAMADAHPDAHVLIIDLSMPVMDGIQATKLLRKQHPGLRILALTQNSDSGSITRAVKAGVSGYVIKTSTKDVFVQAIRTVAAGGTYFGDEVEHALFLSMVGKKEPLLGADLPISEREKEILRLIAGEFTTNEIAAQLFLSPYTVETHRKNLIHKLGVRNTAGLVRIAIQYGFIDTD